MFKFGKILTLFVVISFFLPINLDLFAKRSGGTSGGRSFSSRSNSSSSSSSSSSYSSSSYNRGSRSNGNLDAKGTILLLIILFAIFIIGLLRKEGSKEVDNFQIDLSLIDRNKDTDEFLDMILSFNNINKLERDFSDKLKDIMEAIQKNKESININTVEITRGVTFRKTKKMSRKLKESNDIILTENLEKDNLYEGKTFSFFINFMIDNSPSFAPELYRGKENFELIKEILEVLSNASHSSELIIY